MSTYLETELLIRTVESGVLLDKLKKKECMYMEKEQEKREIFYCESCELELEDNVGICDKCIQGIQWGIIDPPEGW